MELMTTIGLAAGALLLRDFVHWISGPLLRLVRRGLCRLCQVL
jgi:hypothetical protein